MVLSRRSAILATPALLLVHRARAAAEPIRFAVGPFQPTAGDTRTDATYATIEAAGRALGRIGAR